jgi:hypothetical protein
LNYCRIYGHPSYSGLHFSDRCFHFTELPVKKV